VISSTTRPYVVARRAVFAVKKPLVGILVYRNLLRALLYLISPAPGTLEVIILKNAEPGRNYSMMPDGDG